MKISRNVNINDIGPVLFEHSVQAKRIIISIRPQKGVRVAIPDRTSFKSALEFVYAKEIRIRKHLAKIEQCQNQGKVVANALATIEKASSRKKLTTRLKQLAEKHGFTYNRVFMRNQETRWGSCSRKNNISLNMELVILPEGLIDYVILHELVHTRIHNHAIVCQLAKIVHQVQLSLSLNRRGDKGQTLKAPNWVLTNRKSDSIIVRTGTNNVRKDNIRKRLEVKSD